MPIRPRPTAAALALAAFSSLSACATIFTGSTDPLKFDANVPGVRLSLDGQYLGELPLSRVQSRSFMGGQQFIAKFEAPGYETQEFRIHREFNTVAILDISSPLTSGGVDVLTGSLMRFSPLEYHVIMRPVQPPPAHPAGPPQPSPSAPPQAYPPPAPPPPAGAPTVSPGTSASDRGLRLHQFAAANFRRLQADLARGGGEHLTAAAAIAVDGTRESSARVERAALGTAPILVAASTPVEFTARFERVVLEATSTPATP